MSQPGGSSGPSKKPEEKPSEAAKKEKEEEKKKKEEERKKVAQATVAVGFMAASMSAMGQFVSPYNTLMKYVKAVLTLLFFVLAGSIIAPAEGGIVLAAYALLVVPTLVMGLVASATAPLLRAAGRAVLSARDYIVRPIYDFLVLMTIGLPWSITWFWEGKVIGLAAMFLSKFNIEYFGYATAFFIIMFFVAGILYSRAVRYTRLPLGRAFDRLLSGGSLILSIYVGAIFAYVLIALMSGTLFFTVVSNIGLIGGFLLTLVSLDAYKDLTPETGRIPLTWNIISMIIGVSALAGTLFYIYAMIALTVYLLILYVVSQDGSWLWYALIAVPASPLVAYYFGFMTKLLIDGYGIALAKALAEVTVFAFLIIGLIVLLVIALYILKIGLPAGVLGLIIAGIIALVVFIFGYYVLESVVNVIYIGKYVSDAYQYLTQPA